MTRAPRVALILAAFVTVVGLAACNPVSNDAATVNGHAITRGTLNGQLEDIAKNTTYVTMFTKGQLSGQQAGQAILGTQPGTFDATFVASRLTNDILSELIREELARRHLTVTKADMDTATTEVTDGFVPSGQARAQSLYLKFPVRFQRQIVADTANQDVVLRNLGGPVVDAAAIQAYYNQHLSQFPPDSVCLSDIGVADQATAASLKAQIDKGADFATVARQKSLDTQTAPQGGAAGCLTASQVTQLGQQSQAVATALSTLAVGQVSAPISNGTAFFLLKITKRTPATLAEMTPQIRQVLLVPSEQLLGTLINKLAKAAKVTVDPRYGSFSSQADPTTGTFSVRPPPLSTATTSPAQSGAPSTTVPGGA